MKMKDSVIIVSGGMDSVTMLYEYKDTIALGVSFDYGAITTTRKYLWQECIANDLTSAYSHSAWVHAPILQVVAARGADAIPEGHYAADNMASTVVPFRNGIMLAIACGLAEPWTEEGDDSQPWRRPQYLSRLP